MAATIGLKGGSGTTASIQINGSDRLTIDTAGNVTASGSLVSTTAIGVVSGGTGLTSAGTVGNSLFSDGSGWTSRAPLVSGTAVTATGTAVDFTGIPAWAKRITVMFKGVSLNGTSTPLIQIGDSGGIENTGYIGVSTSISNGVVTTNSTAGFPIYALAQASQALSGIVTLALIDTATNSWVLSGVTNHDTSTIATQTSSGSKSLSATLDRIRITTVNGTDTFDAGTINIMYE